MKQLNIFDHKTGRSACAIAPEAIEDAIRGWREPWGIAWDTLEGVEIVEIAA
ncbi:MAG: hypothetical protein Q4B12_04150 [Bowdeniella nasicola]|nr:hypothetical protein [Bowdeniella nasicola]